MSAIATAGGPPLLEVEDLVKRFEVRKGAFGRVTDYVRAVDGVSFTIGAGETLCLVGESGCGKSTTGKTVLKLLEPTAGTIRLRGKDITGYGRKEMHTVRRDVQIVFQDPYSSINPRMSAGNYVGEPLVVHGIASGKEKERQVTELFQKVGLRPDQMRRYPHEFSGGQRQRLAIARALALNPALIIADEPVSALDVSIQASVINLMMDLQRDLGLSYLFISHDIGVVEHIGHRIAVMYLGEVVELAERKSIFTAPRHPYTAALLSAVPIPDPRARRDRRILLSGDVPSPMNPPPGCRFHTRCPFAQDRCKQEAPEFREMAPGHRCACHFPLPLEAPT
jgi:peptide/nickel transport system ATP-binding protein/oligopeptide transport system ATP-binding protein